MIHQRTLVLLLFLALSLLAAACGGATSKIEETNIAADMAAQGALSQAEEPAPAEAPVTHIDSTTRAELDTFLAKGPPFLLGQIQVNPVFKNGAFAGWEMAAFRGELRSVLGLIPGDVVVRVYAMPIERPDQIEAIYLKLMTETHIVLDIVRDGKPQQLSAPIATDEPVASP